MVPRIDSYFHDEIQKVFLSFFEPNKLIFFTCISCLEKFQITSVLDVGYMCYKRKVITFFLKTGSSLVKDVLVDGSELLADIGERLNKEIRAVKNWRNLSYRLNISNETYSAFDTSKEKAKSPTKMMFEWLAKWKPALNIDDLLKSVKEIDRFDVVEIITKEAQAGEFVLYKLNNFVD